MKKNSSNHLLEILTKLASARVRFIVCGGVAVVFHGVERMTVDLDLILDFSPENVKKFISVIKKLKLVPRVPVSPEILMYQEQRKKLVRDKNAVVFTFLDINNPYRMIDVLLFEDKLYEKFFQESIEIKLENQSIRITSKEQIIAMKKKVKPLRDKDKFDINALKNLKKLPKYEAE